MLDYERGTDFRHPDLRSSFCLCGNCRSIEKIDPPDIGDFHERNAKLRRVQAGPIASLHRPRLAIIDAESRGYPIHLRPL